jgi:hypothetical protein
MKATLEPHEIAAGEAVRNADRAMRKAIEELAAKGEVSFAMAALRHAGEELNRAAKSCLAGETQKK